jgi:hypothetical protein
VLGLTPEEFFRRLERPLARPPTTADPIRYDPIPRDPAWRRRVTPAILAVHLRHARVLERMVDQPLPAGRSKEFARYRRDWRNAVSRAIQAGEFTKQTAPAQAYIVRNGWLLNRFERPPLDFITSFRADTDHTTHVSTGPGVLREHYGRHYGRKRRTALLGADVEPVVDSGARYLEPEHGVTDSTRAARENRGRDAQHAPVLSPGSGTSLRPAPKNPRGAQWLATISRAHPNRVHAIVAGLTNAQRQVFDWHFFGREPGPNNPRFAAWVPLTVGEIGEALCETKGKPASPENIDQERVNACRLLDRIRQRFRDANLPDPLPPRDGRGRIIEQPEAFEYAGTAWQDTGYLDDMDVDEQAYESSIDSFELEKQRAEERKRRTDAALLGRYDGQELAHLAPAVRDALRDAMRRSAERAARSSSPSQPAPLDPLQAEFRRQWREQQQRIEAENRALRAKFGFPTKKNPNSQIFSHPKSHTGFTQHGHHARRADYRRR